MACCLTAPAQQRDTLPIDLKVPYYFMNHVYDSITFCSNQHDGFDCNAVSGCLAQYVPQACTGDIYHCITPCGSNSLFFNTHTQWGLDTSTHAIGFYPDTLIRVIGVAWTSAYCWWCLYNYGGGDTMHISKWDSVRISAYIPNGAYMTEVARTVHHGRENYTRELKAYRGSTLYRYTSSPLAPQNAAFPLYESYFDHEITVSDSIYIATDYYRPISHLGNPCNPFMMSGLVENHTNPPFAFPLQSYRIRRGNIDAPWEYGEYNTYPLVFLIIRRDCDTCFAVENLRFSRVAQNMAFVQWDADSTNRDWQLCYAPAGSAPADTASCVLPQQLLPGLDPERHYDVLVRSRCRFGRFEWSPWKRLDLCLDCPPEGIAAAGPVPTLDLSPNPASHTVRVGCAEPMAAVELYDAAGRLALRLDMAGQPSATLDISALAPGHYTLLAHTGSGVVAKGLVVK